MLSTVFSRNTPEDTLRNNDVVITPKRHNFDVITSKLRRSDIITTLLIRHVFSGTLETKGHHDANFVVTGYSGERH